MKMWNLEGRFLSEWWWWTAMPVAERTDSVLHYSRVCLWARVRVHLWPRVRVCLRPRAPSARREAAIFPLFVLLFLVRSCFFEKADLGMGLLFFESLFNPRLVGGGLVKQR